MPVHDLCFGVENLIRCFGVENFKENNYHTILNRFYWKVRNVLNPKSNEIFIKMTPLETHKMVLTNLCISSSDDDKISPKGVIRILVNFLLLTLISCFVISTAVFYLKSTDLEDKLFAVFQICGCLSLGYSFIVGILSRRKVANIFKDFDAFYDECKWQFFHSISLRFLIHWITSLCRWKS